MKKLFTTILAFVYLSSSMGATIHLHYCMGKLASWGLIDHESKNCAQCGMTKQSPDEQGLKAKLNCCKDEHKQIKTDKDQKLVPSDSFKYNNSSPVIAINQPDLQSRAGLSISIAHPNSNAPPLLNKFPLFILYRNFRL